MFFLGTDVIHDGFKVILTDTEASISLLPCEVMHAPLLVIDPFGTTGFNGLYQICDGDCARNDAEDVHVVFRSAHLNAWTMVGVQNADDVCVNLVKMHLGNEIGAPFRREHDVQIAFCKRLRHNDWRCRNIAPTGLGVIWSCGIRRVETLRWRIIAPLGLRVGATLQECAPLGLRAEATLQKRAPLGLGVRS